MEPNLTDADAISYSSLPNGVAKKERNAHKHPICPCKQACHDSPQAHHPTEWGASNLSYPRKRTPRLGQPNGKRLSKPKTRESLGCKFHQFRWHLPEELVPKRSFLGGFAPLRQQHFFPICRIVKRETFSALAIPRWEILSWRQATMSASFWGVMVRLLGFIAKVFPYPWQRHLGVPVSVLPNLIQSALSQWGQRVTIMRS